MSDLMSNNRDGPTAPAIGPVTCDDTSGWRDLNPRPLDPQIKAPHPHPSGPVHHRRSRPLHRHLPPPPNRGEQCLMATFSATWPLLSRQTGDPPWRLSRTGESGSARRRDTSAHRYAPDPFGWRRDAGGRRYGGPGGRDALHLRTEASAPDVFSRREGSETARGFGWPSPTSRLTRGSDFAHRPSTVIRGRLARARLMRQEHKTRQAEKLVTVAISVPRGEGWVERDPLRWRPPPPSQPPHPRDRSR